MSVTSLFRQPSTCLSWPNWIVFVKLPEACCSARFWQKLPLGWSKKLRSPPSMSCRSAAPQNHRRLRRIGPPYSTESFVTLFSGLPDRKPLDEAVKSAGVTFSDCVDWFSNVVTAVPLNTLLPLLVTRLMDRPLD